MIRWLCLLLIIAAFPLKGSEEAVCREIDALHIIGHYQKAADLALAASLENPCGDLYQRYIKALASLGDDGLAIDAYRTYCDICSEPQSRALLEFICWAILKNGIASGTHVTKAIATLGAAMTSDVHAVDVLLNALASSSVRIRALALELTPLLRDAPLCDEVAKRITSEKDFRVRLNAIGAAGKLRLVSSQPKLQTIISSARTSPEEKWAAIEAICQMTEEISEEDLSRLITHPRAGMRELSAQICIKLNLLDRFSSLLPLLNDRHPRVRMFALTALGSLGGDQLNAKFIAPLLQDTDSTVAITAAYLTTLLNPKEGIEVLEKWLFCGHAETMRLAAAALARTGARGVPLAQKIVLSHPDLYVRANVALGLIGQQIDVKEHAEILHELLQKKEKWMWQADEHPYFRVLCPSKVAHRVDIPSYPELTDQLCRLELLGILAVLEHPQAEESIKTFLLEHNWGIGGAAALLLLQEGDASALDLIRHLLDDPDSNIRVQAALALAIWGKDPGVIPVLEKAYPGASRDLKIRILEGMGFVGSPEAVPFLLECLDEPFQTLRILAASAMIRALNH